MRKHLLSSYLVLKKPCQKFPAEGFSTGEAGKLKHLVEIHGEGRKSKRVTATPILDCWCQTKYFLL